MLLYYRRCSPCSCGDHQRGTYTLLTLLALPVLTRTRRCTMQEVIELGRLELRTPLDAVVELVWQWQASDDSGRGWAQRYDGDAERSSAAGGVGWA